MAENKDTFHASMEGNYSVADIEEIRLKTLDFEKHYAIKAQDDFFKDYSLIMSLLAGEVGSQCLVQKVPVLIKNNSQREFITSDNPGGILFSPKHATRTSLKNSITQRPTRKKQWLWNAATKSFLKSVATNYSNINPFTDLTCQAVPPLLVSPSLKPG